MPIWNIFPASLINNQTLTSKIPTPITISAHGQISSKVSRIMSTAGDVNGIYDPIWAISQLGSSRIGLIKMTGRNGSISAIPLKLPDAETSSIVAPSPTNSAAKNKYPNIAINNKIISSGTNRYSNIVKSNFQITSGIANPIHTNT